MKWAPKVEMTVHVPLSKDIVLSKKKKYIMKKFMKQVVFPRILCLHVHQEVFVPSYPYSLIYIFTCFIAFKKWEVLLNCIMTPSWTLSHQIAKSPSSVFVWIFFFYKEPIISLSLSLDPSLFYFLKKLLILTRSCVKRFN